MIRNFAEKDIEFLQQNYIVESFTLLYHGGVIKDKVYTSVDENGSINGILFYRYAETWYAENTDYNRIIPVICTESDDVYDELVEYAKCRFLEMGELFTDKNAALVIWEDANDYLSAQKLLRLGFIEYSVCPCCKYDLTGEIIPFPIPDGMHIEELIYEPEQVNKFIEATKKTNDGNPDDINELWFMSGEPTHKVYMLMDGETIVSSAAMWKITDERAAIENIFTLPDYRRRNMARVIITNTLNRIKEQGYDFATLSMRGRNLYASRLYQSLGFELYFNQIEFIYPFIQNQPSL